MPWLLLACTILFEVSGTVSMKLADGFTRPVPSVLVFVFYGLSLGFLTLTLKFLHLSTAYAIWSGAGTALTAVVGIAWFAEPVSALKVAALALIILGVAGLHLGGGH